MRFASDTSPPPAFSAELPAAVVPADAAELLRAYRCALGATSHLPPSHSHDWGWLLPVMTALRPTWGLQRFAVEHVRRRVEMLSRAYCVRLALGEDDGNDAADREALERFAASLPPKPGAVRQAMPLFAILLVAQLLVAWLGDLDGERKTYDQIAAVVDLNPAHASEAAKALVNASLAVILDLVGVLTLSVYFVLRPLVFGFRLKRMLFAEPDALRRSNGKSPLGEFARRLSIHDREVALFRALGMPPPGEPGLDLRVKAVLVVFCLAAGVYFLLDTPERDIALGCIFLVITVARGAWLMRRARRRNLTRDGLVASHAQLQPPPRVAV